MPLNLRRALIFFDLETTGINILNDRIVEISIIKVIPNGEMTQHTMRVNPEMHIPAEATAIHGISDDDVKDKPTFRQIAKTIAQMFQGCDIAGFNSNKFDIPLLDQEFSRVGVDFDLSKARFIDVQTIFHKKEPRNLSAAYRFYCNGDLENAHSANADTLATYEVLKAQLEKYPDLPNTVEELARFSSQNRNVDFVGRLIYDDKDREVINFGKYKGRVAEEVLRTDHGYYDWIMRSDFTQNTKNAFTRIRMRIK